MSKASPRIGFVSLGCPKATWTPNTSLPVCAPRVTRLRRVIRRPTLLSSTPAASSTAPWLNRWKPSAKRWTRTARLSSPAAWAPRAISCKKTHPKVLAVTGPHATDEVMDAVHQHLPRPHDPYIDLVPPQGVRLTPQHFAYLKISEGCNHRCTFCIIPACAAIW